MNCLTIDMMNSDRNAVSAIKVLRSTDDGDTYLFNMRDGKRMMIALLDHHAKFEAVVGGIIGQEFDTRYFDDYGIESLIDDVDSYFVNDTKEEIEAYIDLFQPLV